MNRRTFIGTVAASVLAPPSCAKANNHDDHRQEIIKAIIQVESGGDPSAVGDGGLAVGILQIHPIMVVDVNRILGHRMYYAHHRFDPVKSIEMFDIYTNHYSKGATDEVIARRWNGGPRGDTKAATLPYWRKVQKELGR